MTSSQVKARYNRKNYDQISFRAGKGALQAVHDMAELRGMTVAGYLKHLIIADAESAGNGEISRILGGGGELYGLPPVELGALAISLMRDIND